MNKPLTVAHVLPQHASLSLIACRTPITQLSTPIDKHQSYGFPSGHLREVGYENNTNSHTFRRFWRQNPGLSSSGQRIRFTECQQICLTINKYSHPNIAIRKIRQEELCIITLLKRKDYYSDLLTV